jgi:hypothetical protein
MPELIDGNHGLKFEPGRDQGFGVPGEGRRIARNGDDPVDRAGRQLPGLRFRALTWRIDHDAIEVP